MSARHLETNSLPPFSLPQNFSDFQLLPVGMFVDMLNQGFAASTDLLDVNL